MLFEVKNGSFAWPGKTPLFSGLNLRVCDAQILSVLGANGAGKTTLLKCMLGLLPWSAGASFYDGTDVAKLRPQQFWRQVGYIPQARQTAFAYTAREMVLLGRNAWTGTFRQPGKEDYRIAEEAMEQIGISYLKDSLCSRISGGELQMVLIARALAARPKLLVLDEPESNLDFRNQRVILDTIRMLSREQKIASIVNTHYPDHGLELSDQALLLLPDAGALCGPTGKVLTEETLSLAFSIPVGIYTVDTGEKVCQTVLAKGR